MSDTTLRPWSTALVKRNIRLSEQTPLLVLIVLCTVASIVSENFLTAFNITNLLLQDAATGRTPRQRGLTLVKEARARAIPLLIGSDNVQDPFCRVGSLDPVEAMQAAVLAGQLDEAFDSWSQALCRADWLGREPAPHAPALEGRPADLVVFPRAEATAWPSRAAERRVLRRWVCDDGAAAVIRRHDRDAWARVGQQPFEPAR